MRTGQRYGVIQRGRQAMPLRPVHRTGPVDLRRERVQTLAIWAAMVILALLGLWVISA